MNWYRTAFPVEDANIRSKKAPKPLDTAPAWAAMNDLVRLHNELKVKHDEYWAMVNAAEEMEDPEQKKRAMIETGRWSWGVIKEYKSNILPILDQLRKFLNRFRRQAKYYTSWDRVKNWELESVTRLWKKDELGGQTYLESHIDNIQNMEGISTMVDETEEIYPEFQKLLEYMDANGPSQEGERPDIIVDFDYRGFRFHNRGHLDADSVKETLELLDIVIERLQSIGLGHLIYGDVELFKNMNVGGYYFASSDLIKLEAGHTGVNNVYWIDALIHEFAHRHWYKFMNNKQRRGYFEEAYAPFAQTIEGKAAMLFGEDRDQAISKYPDQNVWYTEDLKIYPVLEHVFRGFQSMHHERGEASWDKELMMSYAPYLQSFDSEIVDLVLDYCSNYFKTRARKDKLYSFVAPSDQDKRHERSLSLHGIIDFVVKSLNKKALGPDLRRSESYEEYVSIPAVSDYGRKDVEEHFAEAVMYLADGKELSTEQKNLLSKWGNINV